MSVHSGAHRRAAQGHLRQRLLRPLHPLYAATGLSRIAQEFLPKPDGRGVLQVGAAGFYDRPEFLGLLLKLLGQVFKSGDQVLLDRQQRRQMDRGRNHVVG